MKICCMIASLRLGGAERQLTGLAVLLRAEGHEVEVLTYRDGSFYEGELSRAGVPHIFIKQRRGELTLVRDIASHLKQSGCEVLISFLAGTNIKACMVKALCPDLKLIVSERNCNTSIRLHDRLRFAQYRRHAWRVVCNSYAQSEFIRAHAPSLKGRLYTIPNFTDLEKFRPSPSGVKEGPFTVITTARLDRRKNAIGLIKAAALCPGIRFEWYGESPGSAYSARCRALIDALDLQDRFFIYQPSTSPEKLYRKGQLFCLPSFYEGTPNALAEALACGLPAAVSAVSDNSLYVHEGKNGVLFDPKDPRSIASAIQNMASLSEDALREAGQESRRIAEKAFGKEQFIQRYSELLSGPRGGSKGIS